MYSKSSLVCPLHTMCGTTGISYRCWIAAAIAMVPGLRLTLCLCISPPPKSLYTYSLRWVVMLMYLGLYSFNLSIVLNN